ncbi:WD40/YVTN/BNR-like repeat-containing protein [Bacterioplanoides pacificum]|uniref:WD40/YVTN/BNR-like repeat-containing protein n=1 Tax=Bacterioplanoides pacificum TaxID=1171596 RepID=A0ABV7VSM2_9GAMM
MLFNLVRPGAGTALVRTAGFGRMLVVLTLLISQMSLAAWKDPLDTPSASTSIAHQTLLLDVVQAGERLVAVGSHGHIIYSDDNGSSWQQGKVPVSITLTAVYFSSPQHGWAVGHDGVILATTDGGSNWTRQFDGYSANKAIVAAAKNKKQRAENALLSAEEAGNDVAVEEAEMALENATYALEDAEYDVSTGSTKPFLDVWFYDARRGFALGAYGMFFATEDGGASWQDVSARLPNPERLHLNSITLVDNRSLVVVGEMGLIMRSDDLGASWRKTPSPYEGSLFGLVNAGEQQLLFGLRGHVFSSVDGGISWTEASTGSQQTLLSGYVGRSNTLLVGNAGSVIVFDKALKNSRTLIIEGRKAYAAAVQAPDGTFVIVGEVGVQRLNANGELLDQSITMAAGDF